MTTRYLTTDQNGNGSQTYWDINGYFLHGPSGEKLNLGGGNSLVTASNEIVQIGTSYLRIPQGISNERPNPSYAGMIRYLTDSHVIEYYDGNLQQWLPISQPPPTLNTVSPVFFNIGTDNSFNLTGSSFGLTGASIVVIGNSGSGTIINSTVSSVLTESSAVVQFDASATQNLTDISNELPFAMRITNNNSGLSSLLQNAITNANVGPIIIQPNPQTIPFQTFPVQDPSANYTLIGEDESSPPHYPFNSITITSGTAGGITDVSFIEPSGALISVPSGNRTLHTAGNYPFNVKIVDGSGAFNNTTLTLALADPIVTSIVPSSFAPGISVDLSVNGNYFVNDSGVSYVRQSDGSVVTPTTTYKSINLLETNVTFSNEGVYDISVNNGSVFKLYPSVLSVFFNSLNFVSGNTLPSPIYVDSGNTIVGSPVVGGFTIYKFTTTSSTYVFTISKTISVVEYLIIAGGGGGGPGYQAGGGGAGGVLQDTSLTLTDSTNYTVAVGPGGAGGNNSATLPSPIKGSNGSDSSLTGGVLPSLTATGGGGGASYNNGIGSGNGLAGGSGGGAGATNGTESGGTGVAGPPRQGYDGGGVSGYAAPYCGGGGGGAGAVGSLGGGSNLVGDGGIGITSSITGVSINYAGGGGGGSYQTGSDVRVANRTGINSGVAKPGTGGVYGGGYGAHGSAPLTAATAGAANTGGGGGAGALGNVNDPGASGGSGIVVIRFPST